MKPKNPKPFRLVTNNVKEANLAIASGYKIIDYLQMELIGGSIRFTMILEKECNL